MHSRYRADSEYKLHVEVNRKGSEVIDNTFTHNSAFYAQAGALSDDAV